MCGRFTLHASTEEIAREFDLATMPALAPRYNIAPSQALLAIRLDEGQRRSVPLRWGLVPHWATDPKIAYKMINARGETVADKPSFRDAFKKRRCLIPADGFYEWKKLGKAKQPYHIRRVEGRPFAFAGLWERWQPPNGEPLETCTIVTTTANAVLAELHERMPVMLLPEAYAEWLDPTRPATRLKELIAPYPAELLVASPVSTRVNSPKFDDAACLQPSG